MTATDNTSEANLKSEPEFEYINKLRAQISPQNPLSAITEDFIHNDNIDIIRIDLEKDNGEESPVIIKSREHLQNRSHCDNLLEQLQDTENFPPNDNRTIVLLVEDISLGMVDFLCGSLDIPPFFIFDFARGIRGTTTAASEAFLDRAEDGSWFWRELLWAKEFKIMKRRQLFPEDDGIFHADWNRVCITSQNTQDKTEWTLAEEDTKYKRKILDAHKPGEGHHKIAQYRRFKMEGFYRKSRIFRASVPIAVEIPRQQTEAAEEKFSRIRRRFNGHNIVVCMFDPHRTIVGKDGEKKFDVYYGIAERMRPAPEHKSVRKLDDKSTNEKEKDIIPVDTTRDAFIKYLEHWSNSGNLRGFDTCELHFIRGILSEFSDVLSVMEESLLMTDYQMPNLALLQEMVRTWEKMFTRFRPVLADMESSLRGIKYGLDFMKCERENTPHDAAFEKEMMKTVRSLCELKEYLDFISQRIERTFQALMSSMSIIESQQAISQTSSVGKLTELAFIFIPLTFAATFYSMQIESLDPSVTKFLVLAGALLAVSFTARLLIRSRILRIFKDSLKDPIYTAGVVQKGAVIPTLKYCRFYIQKMVAKHGTQVFMFCIIVGLPIIITQAKTLTFKILASIFTGITGLVLATKPLPYRFWEPKVAKKLIMIACVYSILVVCIETQLETAVKIAISGALGVVFAITPTLLVKTSNPDDSVLGLVSWVGFMLTPTILIWHSWSGQPQIEAWQKGLATIAIYQASLLWTPFSMYRRIDWEWTTYDFCQKLFFLLSIIPGIPIVVVWTYGLPDNHPSRIVQIVITALSVWVSMVLVYFLDKWFTKGGPTWQHLGPQAIHIFTFGVATNMMCLFFPLMIWIGELENLDKMSTAAKISVTVTWVLFWWVIGGFWIAKEGWVVIPYRIGKAWRKFWNEGDGEGLPV